MEKLTVLHLVSFVLSSFIVAEQGKIEIDIREENMNDLNLTYYTRRWNSRTTLAVRKIATGWHISHKAINGDTDREGVPILESNLHQDNVKFPHDLGAFLGFVWRELDSGAIDQIRAQEMLDQLGEWISACETSQPLWRGWNI